MTISENPKTPTDTSLSATQSRYKNWEIGLLLCLIILYSVHQHFPWDKPYSRDELIFNYIFIVLSVFGLFLLKNSKFPFSSNRNGSRTNQKSVYFGIFILSIVLSIITSLGMFCQFFDRSRSISWNLWDWKNDVHTLLIPVIEEIFFRSVIMVYAIKLKSQKIDVGNLIVMILLVLLSAYTFSCYHMEFWGDLHDQIFIFWAGLIFGAMYLSSEKIWYPIAFHVLHNFLTILHFF